MPLVTFRPLGKSATAPAGTSLLDAAAQAGVTITAPCGGEGVCGECRVRIDSRVCPAGTGPDELVERVPRGCLSPDDLAEGWVLACSTRVIADVTVHVPEEVAEAARIVTGAADRREATASPGPISAAEPLARKLHLAIKPPTLDNSLSDLERLARAIGAAVGARDTTAGLDVIRGLAGALREKDHAVTATIIDGDDGPVAEVIRIEAGDTTECQVGLAIDVGTTTCAVSLVDLAHNHLLGTAVDYNGQLARGADIISRINYAATPQRVDELRRLVLDTVNRMIGGLCADNKVVVEEIDNAAIAGNTTMIHLLLGLDPQFIRLDPYTPTVNRPPRLRAGEVGLAMNPRGCVLFAPGVGSYVGGDITAGLLHTALAKSGEQVRLFLDIGTNGEVVIGTGEWLMACAASAGPAFEGGGVSCGMRAGNGAIERVRIDPASGRAEVTVIGGGRPRGVCGSGMIDLLAELWTAGLLDPSGKLDPSSPGDVIHPTGDGGRNLAYTIVPESDGDDHRAIIIDECDIQNLLRTKAAVYSACALMLKSVDLDFDAITEVYVAGGFGRFLDLKKSIMIGLLPDLPLDRFTYLGNAALAGARQILCDADARHTVTQLADRMTYLELNADPAYMNEYTAALFLPHTDIDRFPTARAAVAAHRSDAQATIGRRIAPRSQNDKEKPS